VDLPAPRKPESTVTGIGLIEAAIAAWGIGFGLKGPWRGVQCRRALHYL
jgi:hypothetical protein